MFLDAFAAVVVHLIVTVKRYALAMSLAHIFIRIYWGAWVLPNFVTDFD
jgi:hypothetical protein